MEMQFLLLQVRDDDDPMRPMEVICFADALTCQPSQIRPFDLLTGIPTEEDLNAADVVLIGGSGKYSATANAPWLDRCLAFLRLLHGESKPTFASCWGFQAMSRAMGGTVIHDLDNAELGTREIVLTPEGLMDPVFRNCGASFHALMGHEDHVITLPEDAILLASSDRVINQAYRFHGKPIYCTQFHPELDRDHFLSRVRAYPEYIRRIEGVDYETFAASCRETPVARLLMTNFLDHVTT